MNGLPGPSAGAEAPVIKAALHDPPGCIIEVQGLSAWYGSRKIINNISMGIGARSITALIGPSGCGKSTFIRCLNRMHEVAEGGRVAGKVLKEGQDIYAPGIDPVDIRRQVGMVFQKASVFPAMSIFNNVAAGITLTRFWNRRSDVQDVVERSLKKSALWDEVKDKLDQPGASLSGGQQQRLCIARATAIEPEIILMDEPCSALDPISTLKIEELMLEIKKEYTVVIVTHNMQQAARVSDWTGFLLLGELIEYSHTREVFTVPKDKRTEDYITGRFG